MDFMPHGHCYFWTPGLVWLQVITNAVIGLAYLGIALTLIRLVRALDLPFATMYVAFGAFILLCGVTHFMDVLVVWEPRYWIDGGIRAATAVVSLGTAVALASLVPRAKALAARVADERRRAVTELEASRTREHTTKEQMERLALEAANQLDEARRVLVEKEERSELRRVQEQLAQAHQRIADLEGRLQ